MPRRPCTNRFIANGPLVLIIGQRVRSQVRVRHDRDRLAGRVLQLDLAAFRVEDDPAIRVAQFLVTPIGVKGFPRCLVLRNPDESRSDGDLHFAAPALDDDELGDIDDFPALCDPKTLDVRARVYGIALVQRHDYLQWRQCASHRHRWFGREHAPL